MENININKTKEEKRSFKNECIEYMNSANYYKISSYYNILLKYTTKKKKIFH